MVRCGFRGSKVAPHVCHVHKTEKKVQPQAQQTWQTAQNNQQQPSAKVKRWQLLRTQILSRHAKRTGRCAVYDLDTGEELMLQTAPHFHRDRLTSAKGEERKTRDSEKKVRQNRGYYSKESPGMSRNMSRPRTAARDESPNKFYVTASHSRMYSRQAGMSRLFG